MELEVKTIQKCPVKYSSLIPTEILDNSLLNEMIAKLPKNYSFEVHKCVWMCQKNGSKRVALQLPEGLLMYSCILSDILEEFANVETVILGDVTYGACCVDDFTAKALGCDFLIHYGHSCLVPISTTTIKSMYVFVEIQIDVAHLRELIKTHFTTECRIAMVSTIQFVASVHSIKEQLHEFDITVPQSKPLSRGEVLGCTAPNLNLSVDAIIYVGDGRFHLEAMMIANPGVDAYRYDPYSKVFSQEYYENEEMKASRQSAIKKAANANHFGLIIGTLGRQGNPKVFANLELRLKENGKNVTLILLSEITPQKLGLFTNIDAWVQVACPRLSIDWGDSFSKPLLTPYEAYVALEQVQWQSTYPMDFYANDSLGEWTPNHVKVDETKKNKNRSALLQRLGLI